jgi:hypothetical protein
MNRDERMFKRLRGIMSQVWDEQDLGYRYSTPEAQDIASLVEDIFKRFMLSESDTRDAILEEACLAIRHEMAKRGSGKYIDGLCLAENTVNELKTVQTVKE